MLHKRDSYQLQTLVQYRGVRAAIGCLPVARRLRFGTVPPCKCFQIYVLERFKQLVVPTRRLQRVVALHIA